MIRFDASQFGSRDREGLLRYFEEVRRRVRESGESVLANISLNVRHIDPLAVLESIFQPEEHHFYMEHPNQEWALAGADAVLSVTASGPDRMAQVAQFCDRVFSRCIAVGELDSPFAGPHVFTAVAFEDGVKEGTNGLWAFVPRWQVGFLEGEYTACANVLVEAGSDTGALASRVWAAHEKFSAFEYGVAPTEGAGMTRIKEKEKVKVKVKVCREWGGEVPFGEKVAEAVRRIREGRYKKIVLGRALELECEKPFSPFAALDWLRNRYAGCYTYACGSGDGAVFLGATPEKLISVRGQVARTEAIAGSVARGGSAREDALLGKALLTSGKDLHEHALVVEAIVRRLEGLGLKVKRPRHPRLLNLPNVVHLHSPLSAVLEGGKTLLDLVEALHPTPAVGGSPREAAVPEISELEGFPRGLYAGALGWTDARGDGLFAVGIRACRLWENRAVVFAGCGIVDGSEPERERRETEMKFRPMLEALTGSPDLPLLAGDEVAKGVQVDNGDSE